MTTSEKWNGQREFGRVKWNGSRSERNGTGSGCRCRSAFGWEDHRVAHHSCVIVCRLEQMDLSVRLSTWFVILDMRGRGGVRITNQQKVRLINSHANWLAEMHSCTLQASHLYYIYIYIYRYRTQAPVWSLHHYPLQFLTFPDIQITPLFPCPTLLLSAREVWLISIWSIFPMV